MAKQESIFEISGSIGNVTFSKGRNGKYIVKRKSPGLSAQQIASDPKFTRIRENMSEFTEAAKKSKHLRYALSSLIKNLKDQDMLIRMNSTMFKVLKTDTVNGRGKRKVEKGDLTLLKDFEFNKNAVLTATMAAKFTKTINRTTGAVSIAVPPFVPERVVSLPVGGTHFVLTCAALSIDLEDRTEVVSTQRSAIIPWNELETTAINLAADVEPNSTNPIILAFGVEFYQEMNGIQYLLKNGAFTSLSIVEVNIPPAPGL
jgi:hypothetical protein